MVNFSSEVCLFLQKLVTTNVHAVNCRDVDGRHSTPLHFAAGYNRVAVVEYLLEHGADVHAKDKGYVSFFLSPPQLMPMPIHLFLCSS